MEWPRRRHHRVPNANAPTRLPQAVTEALAQGVPNPAPVPRTRTQALLATLVNLFVLLVLVGFAVYMVGMWPQTGILGRVAIAALGAGVAFTFSVFAVSLLFYTLPTMLGLRRPRDQDTPEV